MDDLVRLLVLLGLAGLGLTVAGAVALWHMDEGRRIRRGLKVILGGELHGYLVARGRGRGLGFNFSRNQLAVAWDHGAWGLVYRIDELRGAEVIADGMVAGRVFRGETRRALDSLGGAEERVTLRLVFDDVAHPEFLLDLWLAADESRRDAWTAADALEEANRWLARLEALFRRPGAPVAPPAAAPQPQPAPVVAASSPPATDDDPPWDEDDVDEAENEGEDGRP
jgi:hypothetical protein